MSEETIQHETVSETDAEDSITTADSTADEAGAAGTGDETAVEAEPTQGEQAATDQDGTSEKDGDEVDEDDDESGSTLDTEGEIAADYLEELLDIADFDGDIDTYVESNRAHVSILTEGDVLIGAKGEVLEALQELSRLAVMTETGNRSRLMLDIGGYRDKRRKVLVELATDAVSEVKSSGDSVRLDPMNPFERKIVHDVVAAGGLTSESEGEEPSRRVVILPSA